jgi:hypothetical protein
MKSAIEQILNSTSEIFETAWSKELERIEGIIKQFEDFEVTDEMVSLSERRIKSFSSFPHNKSEEEITQWKKDSIKKEMFILNSMFSWSLDKIKMAQQRGVYNTLDKREYNQYQDWLLILHNYQSNKEKFKVWLDKYKTDYYNDLVSKLTQAVSRYLQGYNAKPHSRVRVNMGPRGYEISCDVISPDGTPKVFYTQAHGAGGWNIQKYHYRYRSTLR